ncbi:MAG: 30S ribosomal protein S30e [Desulfurococcaceae archaeon]
MPTHGSLTKAGKVRSQTPKIPPKQGKNKPPRVRNRVEYVRRFVKQQESATSPQPVS